MEKERLNKLENKPRGTLLKRIKKDRYLILLFLPVFIWYIIFCYLPMPGAVIAFKAFLPGGGIFAGDWVGLKWFRQFLNSAFAFRIIRNTFLLSFFSLIFGFPVPIIFALCVSEIKNMTYKRAVQTASYLPHFISTVVVVGMVKNFLSPSNGIVNAVISALGGDRIDFFMDPKYFRTIYVASGIWQSFGYSSIIYIAAIVGVDPELYESAWMDGINKIKEIIYITIPIIAPTIITLLLLSLGGLLSVGFEKVFLLYNASIYSTADVISTYVYRSGIIDQNYSFSTAVGLFNSLVNFALVFAANLLARKATNTSLW